MKFIMMSKDSGNVIMMLCPSCNGWHELDQAPASGGPRVFELKPGKAMVCKCGKVFTATPNTLVTVEQHRCDKLPLRTVIFCENGIWQMEDEEGNRFGKSGIAACPYCGEKLQLRGVR